MGRSRQGPRHVGRLRVELARHAPTSRGEPLRPRTKEFYEGFLRLHILPAFGAQPLARLNTVAIRAWHAALLADGPGASTAAKCYRLLRTILSTAMEDGLLAVNPCNVKGGWDEPCEERQPPSLAQVYALADAVQPQFRCLVLLAAFGGLRRGELLALTRRDVDLLHRTVDVRRQRQDLRGGGQLVGPPKTEAGRRTVTLPAGLLPELEDHLTRWVGPDPDDLVFPGTKGGPLRVSVWQPEWFRARRSLSLDHVHLHDLRHVAGTMAAATGASTKELMHRLGHASSRAALRYQHATAERDAVIAEGIDLLLRAAQAVPNATVVELSRVSAKCRRVTVPSRPGFR